MELAKEIAGMELKLMNPRLKRMGRAKLMIERDRLAKDLEKHRQEENKTVAKIGIEIIKNFIELSMQMADLSTNMNFKDIQALSTTDFYMTKQWLFKKLKKRTPKTSDDDK